MSERRYEVPEVGFNPSAGAARGPVQSAFNDVDARLTALEEHREAGRYVTAEVQITAQEEQEFPPTETELVQETASIGFDTTLEEDVARTWAFHPDSEDIKIARAVIRKVVAWLDGPSCECTNEELSGFCRAIEALRAEAGGVVAAD